MPRWIVPTTAIAAALALVGLGTRLWGVTAHPRVTWDESHFLRYANAYRARSFAFDIHPPLGKLLLAGALSLAKSPVLPDTAFLSGTSFPDAFPYAAARCATAVAGGLLPLAVFGLLRALGASRKAATLAGVLVILDTGLLAESRIALVNPFMLLFGVLGLAAAGALNRVERRGFRWWMLLATSALLLGASVSVKWTGGGFVLGALAAAAWGERKDLLLRIGTLVTGVCVVYAASFTAHVALSPNAGPGEAYFGARFNRSLVGSADATREGFLPMHPLEKMVAINMRMLSANYTGIPPHEMSSPWWAWPFNQRPIVFWSDVDTGGTRIIGYVGNTAVRIGALLGMIGALGVALFAAMRRRGYALTNRAAVEAPLLLSFTWLVNWVPFAAITRPMFLYHYDAAFMASVGVAAWLVTDGAAYLPLPPYAQKALPAAVALAALAGALAAGPLALGSAVPAAFWR